MENNLLTSDIKGQRTLATVVFTDCVGFSARMSVDEDYTLDLIRRDLQFMKQVCGQFEGRVLKTTGDGLLMCFGSAVKAVECAIAIQQTLTEKAANLPPEDSLEHRIGIHLADMYISSNDVMGNGVNIAARLQTEADPGGICISQTVYDVIKAGLHLETEYLGPRELKNIHEIIPVYKILFTAEEESAVQTLSVIRALEQSRQLPRIKKLLFYVCRNTWESDQIKLNSLNLNELVQELLVIAPTPDRIRSCLDIAVKTLSKQAEYSLVANVLLKEISKLCAAESNQISSARVETKTAAESNPLSIQLENLYEQIAYELEQSGNLLRIKKLAFYVCKKRWENDSNRLDEVALEDLVAELHQVAPTLDRLRFTVDGFVQTLSKQAEYAVIANTIVAKLQKLYGEYEAAFPTVTSPLPAISTAAPVINSPLQSSQQTAYSDITQQLEQEPNLPRIKKLLLYVCRRQWENDPATLDALDLEELIDELHQIAPTSDQLETALNAVVKTLSKQAEYTAIAQTIMSAVSRLYASAAPPAQEASLPPIDSLESLPPPNLEPPKQHSLPSLFDYRLGIMKYANPLRAKILLFSALHQGFNFSSQDWLNLKMHELDGLLRQLFNTCEAYTDMEALLYGTARQLKEPEITMQTAEAVMKCLRPFYLHGRSIGTPNPSPEKFKVGLDDFEAAPPEFAHVSDDDFTCDLLPFAPESAALDSPD